MPDPENQQWLTVRQTAAFLKTSEEMVRRKIRNFELPASRLNESPRSPWMINRVALERQMAVDAHKQRVEDAGIVTGRSDEGGPADEAFIAEIARTSGPDTAASVRQVMDRRQLFARVERDMYADPSVRQQLERLDDQERFEEEARELARRIKRAERLRRRALEILDEEDED